MEETYDDVLNLIVVEDVKPKKHNKKENKKDVNNTRSSQTITHPNTTKSNQRCLTSVIEQEMVFYNAIRLLN